MIALPFYAVVTDMFSSCPVKDFVGNFWHIDDPKNAKSDFQTLSAIPAFLTGNVFFCLKI